MHIVDCYVFVKNCSINVSINALSINSAGIDCFDCLRIDIELILTFSEFIAEICIFPNTGCYHHKPQGRG
jgi:hypothetical protein